LTTSDAAYLSQATFARERAEREAAEMDNVPGRRPGPPPRAPFPSAPQQVQQDESDEIVEYEDEGMSVDSRGRVGGEAWTGITPYASQGLSWLPALSSTLPPGC
jgi:hypothetical protein